MDFRGRKLVGVLGGMGPDAMVDFLAKIIARTPAVRDQDHIPMVIFNYPQIPDRTRSIMSGKTDVLEHLREGIRFLESSNAELVAIPCVSSHYYYDTLAKDAGIPILSIIKETVDFVVRRHPEIRRVGILGTTMTVRKKLFESCFDRSGIPVVVPDDAIQEDHVMKSIYMVKAGDRAGAKENIRLAVAGLMEKGAEAIVAGCTEIPLILDSTTVPVPFIDSLSCLADAVVREAFPSA
jgi:aspartate racemase